MGKSVLVGCIILMLTLEHTSQDSIRIIGDLTKLLQHPNTTIFKQRLIDIVNKPDLTATLKKASIDPVLVKAVFQAANTSVLIDQFNATYNAALTSITQPKRIPNAIVTALDWKALLETMDFKELFLDYPNVTKVVKAKFGVETAVLYGIFTNVDFDKFIEKVNIQTVAEIYLSSDSSDIKNKKMNQYVDSMDIDALKNSIDLDRMFDDERFTNALKNQGIDGILIQSLKAVGVRNFLDAIDLKAVLKQMLQPDGLNSEFVLSKVYLRLVLKNLLKANSLLNITTECGGGFQDMLLPLPNLAKLDITSPDAIFALEHPLLQLIDSWDKLPSRITLGKSNWLGAVDQCSNIPNAKYCLANMDLAIMSGSYGLCLPNVCSEDDGRKILEYLSENTLNGMVKFPRKWGKRANPVTCSKPFEYEKGFGNTLWLVVLFGLLMVIGTAVDETQIYLNKPDQENKENKDKKPKQASIFVKALICFSLTRNTKAIFSTIAPRGAIRSINGIRTLSLLWVAVGHTFAIMQGIPMDNILYLKRMTQEHLSLVVLNAYPSVDSFFVLSGLLLAYLTFKRLDKTDGKLNLLMFYLHRFLRVTPVLMFIILVRTNIFTVINEKSTMGLLRDETWTRKTCQKFWWTNFLYINNFYPKSFWASCHGITWYLANDMQFYIVSPVFLYCIYFLEKKLAKTRLRFWSGAMVLLSGSLVCILINFGLIYHNNYDVVHAAYQMHRPGNPRGKPPLDPQDEIYDKPYTRISPYLIGMLVGYMFSRKLEMQFKHKKLINVIFWIVALIGGYYIVYGPSEMYKEKPTYFTDAQNIAFGSMHMTAWAIAVGWVIYSCHYGMGGIINDFLSWKVWMPLSRLTFCAYLVHTDVAAYFLYVFHNGYHLQRTAFVFHFISISVSTYLLAFIISVSVEVPILNLEKLLLK